MRRTLLLIPHEIAGLTVFGFGWLLIALGIGFVVRLGIARVRGQSLGSVVTDEGVMWAVAAAVVAVLLPMAEIKNFEGEPVGMAIRGYGMLLLIAIVSAVLLAAYRAGRYGLSPESIYSLAPWTLIGGIAGARIFYVIQYRESFYGDSVWATIRNMLVFTEGGLVVYGSLIGGTAASILFLWRRRMPLLTLGDVIIPCVFLGIFFGRLGCLMNGCCYGGRCESGPTAIEFPPGSPVYQEQLLSGELLGLRLDPGSRQIESVEEGSLAEQSGIEAGQRLDAIRLLPPNPDRSDPQTPVEQLTPGIEVVVGGSGYRWSSDELPRFSLPVRAAQLISSGSALAICILLLGLSRWIGRPGVLLFLGFGLYAVVRFGLEWVRVDEAGRFGTSLSISQWVSIVVLICSVAGVIWTTRRPVSARSGPATAT